MRTSGQLLTRENADFDFVVSEAVVMTKNGETRISIDWDEDGEPGHLEGVSLDGMHFAGLFGYPAKDERREYKLTLFKNKQECLLFGRYCDQDDEGIWLFRLRASTGKLEAEGHCFILRGDKEAKPVSKQRVHRKPKAVPKPVVPSKPPVIIHPKQIKDGGLSEFKKRIAKLKPPPVPQQPKSAELDHLLKLTDRGYLRRGRAKVQAELESAKLAAVFKLAYHENAQSEELKSAARQVYERRRAANA